MPRRDFSQRLKVTPTEPGVYLMRSSSGEVLYVGKAVNLRNRIRSYFGSPTNLAVKTRKMVAYVSDFEYLVTESESEALILENTFIKRDKPRFNVRLKDDKHYPYLKVDVHNPWPRVTIARRVENDGARYFGPYASAGSVRRTLEVTKKLFPWRSCTKIITGDDPRPCLDYYIRRCIAPCTSYCTPEEYRAVINQTILFLEGRVDVVLRDLQQRMDEVAEALDFEHAAQYRDQIAAVERVTEAIKLRGVYP